MQKGDDINEQERVVDYTQADKGEYQTVVNIQMFPSEMVTTGTKQ